MVYFLIFVIGSAFGSFLNVVIYRLYPGTGFFKKRSHCQTCQVVLKWHELVPLLSFVWLRGRCRYCRKKISLQYPAVELLSGLFWVATFYKIYGLNFQFSIFNFQFLSFIYSVFILSALLVIAVYDFKWQMIPDKIVFPAIAAVLVFNLFEISKYQNIAIFLWPLFTAITAFLFFFAIYFFSKGRAMGFGDVKLAFLIGFFLSPMDAFWAFNLAFIFGAAFGIILIGLGLMTLKSRIALGPFLALGAAIAYFVPWSVFINFINNF